MKESKKEKRERLFAVRLEKKFRAIAKDHTQRLVGLDKAGWTWKNNTDEHCLQVGDKIYKTESIHEACIIHKKIKYDSLSKQQENMANLLSDNGWEKIEQDILVGTKVAEKERVGIFKKNVYWKKKCGDRLLIKNLNDAWSMQQKNES